MDKLTLERTLIYRGEDGELTRYEIYRTDGSQANNIDSIHVYREKVVDGNRVWHRTGDEVSLNHLGPQMNGGFQTAVARRRPAARDVSSAIEECSKHWSKHYE